MISVSRNDTNRISIRGVFGPGFRRSVERVLTPKQIESLFVELSGFRIDFYEFFSLEVCEVLRQAIRRSRYGVFVKFVKEVIEYIESNTWVKGVVQCRPATVLDRSIHKDIFRFDPLPKQIIVFDQYEKAKTCLGLRGILIHGEAGTGKELHKDTKILSDNGWIPIKDITVGTTVYSQDGSKTFVTGVYYQGKKPLYRVYFEDGRSILAGRDHQWAVYVGSKKTVVTTDYLLDNVRLKPLYIDRARAIQHDGDKITMEDMVSILDTIRSGDPVDTSLLKKIELSTETLRKKFILRLFRYYGVDNIYKTPTIVTIKDSDWLDTVVDIIRSIGYRVFTDRISCDQVRITIDEIPVSRVIKVEYECDDDAYCISVDHPDRLYIAENYIVTHNTFMSLSIAEMTHSQKVLVVCPLNTIDRVWANSITGTDTIYKNPHPVWSSKNDTENDIQKVKYYLTHYEYLSKISKLYPYLKNQKLTIILDESHNLNELTAKRTRLFMNLIDDLKPATVLLLSGTPIKALGRELIPIVKALDPLFTGPVEKRFLKFSSWTSSNIAKELLAKRLGLMRAVVTKDEVNIDKPITETIDIKFKGMDDYTLNAVKDKLKDFIESMVRYIEENKEDFETYYKTIVDQIGSKLQPDTDQYKKHQDYLEMIKKIRTAYENNELYTVKDIMVAAKRYETDYIEPNLKGEALKKFREAKTIYKYPMLKIQGEALGYLTRQRIECFSKIAEVIDYPNIVESTMKKTIIFTSYVDVAKAANKTLTEKYRYRPMTIYGDYTKELTERVRQFISNDKLNPLVTTYKSLSTGVPLVVANVMLIIDPPFRSYILEQAISRIARLGQDSQTYIYFTRLNTKDTNIVDRNFDILKWSIEQVQELTGSDVNFDIETVSNEVIVDDTPSIATVPSSIEIKKPQLFILNW